MVTLTYELKFSTSKYLKQSNSNPFWASLSCGKIRHLSVEKLDRTPKNDAKHSYIVQESRWGVGGCVGGGWLWSLGAMIDCQDPERYYCVF